MGHKDAHWSVPQAGSVPSPHRGGHPGNEHAAGRIAEGELLNSTTAGDAADTNWDVLWIDIGGEG
jgi:hypothetical protein